jgi:HAD superfamily phosphatase (TIGR01681 family)
MTHLRINEPSTLNEHPPLISDQVKSVGKAKYLQESLSRWLENENTELPLEDSSNRANNCSNNQGSLFWLPNHFNFKAALQELHHSPRSPSEQLHQLRQLANHNLDFATTNRLDNQLQQVLAQLETTPTGFARLKLAILSSSVVDHLLAGIRIGALRRGLLVEIYVAPYNQHHQEISNLHSQLYQFAPDAVLVTFDYRNVTFKVSLSTTEAEVKEQIHNLIQAWRHLWSTVTTHLNPTVIQETMVLLPVPWFSEYDDLIPGACRNIITRINQTLQQEVAINHQVLLFDVDKLAASVGKHQWCNETLWYHTKQAVAPVQIPLYGDHLARILGAVRGLSRQCLVLDLDNTLWGGIIDNDKLIGIRLGQSNAEGKAFIAFQKYVKKLHAQGVILAVCSQSDEHHAVEVFEQHPEMVLRREDISVFVANWDNKASNLQKIAQELQIGLDALVFFDDDPVERALVRQFLPMVAVPEVPENPVDYVRCLSRAGYFEWIKFS